MTVYVISDLHLGHANILGFTSRRKFARSIDEHDELLLSNWNETVKSKRNVVIVTGDVAWHTDRARWFFSQAKGLVYLVAGNHDPDQNLLPLFHKVYGAKEIRDCILTHIPVHPQELYHPVRRWNFNIHGHLHDNLVLGPNGQPDPNYINVCCEHTGMRPVDIDALIAQAEMRRRQFEARLPLHGIAEPMKESM